MKLCAKKIPIMTVKGSFFKIKSKNFKLNVLIRQYIVATVVVSLENVFMNSLTIHKVLETLMILTLWSQNLNVFFLWHSFHKRVRSDETYKRYSYWQSRSLYKIFWKIHARLETITCLYTMKSLKVLSHVFSVIFVIQNSRLKQHLCNIRIYHT